MAYVLFSVSAYIFMRAFEVTFSSKQDAVWFKRTRSVIGLLVLYTAIASMLLLFCFRSFSLEVLPSRIAFLIGFQICLTLSALMFVAFATSVEVACGYFIR